ncbi:MAG: DUF4194 domain-containing protein [Oscillospiraceae bacterium]|nr:DUF4194 domain-containing protein [Oscillospiraceae bacterium]
MSQKDELTFSRTLVALFRNIVYRDASSEYWETIELKSQKIEDYVSKIGLTLIVDDMDGYAYLKQRTYGDDEDAVPRLIPRHALGYELSLLLMILRKLLLEFDSSTGDARLILTRQQIINRMKAFLRDTTNEVKMIDSINKNIDRAVSMGFLSSLRGSEDSYEVMRIIRGFVNAEHLDEFNKRLSEYSRYVESDNNGEE